MASSEPPYLPIGTDVSAKYRGAFCEAKVKKVLKSVKCRVYLKETQSSLLVTDEFITGPLAIGANVEVKHPDTGRVMEAVIKQMSDSSMYTVVFDDADERTLRRTQLCLKGDKHFTESETLDNLPLSNPEHFGTPVITRTKRHRTSGGASNADESLSSSEEDESPRKKYRGKNQELVGKPMFYEGGDRKKPVGLPVLVVLPDAHTTELKAKDHVLVRSFKDGKFLSVGRKELIPFTRDIVLKNEDKTLKPAMEKALLYADNRELPLNWKREELLGSDDEDQGDDEGSSEDEEQSEEKDHFVAQLYKFSDDRGTPINKGPCIGTKDLNLYRLFKVVKKLGGYNRVTNQMKWRLVYSKMQLPPSNTASTQIKNAYKKYLHAFEDFYRKLGNTMGTISRPSRSRTDSGRSLLSFRGRDSSRNSDKVRLNKPWTPTKRFGTDNDSASEKAAEETPSEFDSDADGVKMGTPKRPKSARLKAEPKDESATKKDEKEKKDIPVIKKAEDSPRKLQKKLDLKQEVKPEVEKRTPKRKDDGSVALLAAGRGRKEKDTDDETKDKEKKIGRRRSTKASDDVEVADQEPKKPEEVKEKKREESTDNKSETDEKSSEKNINKKKTKSDNGQSEDDSSTSTSTSQNTDNLPVGTRLKVRYGSGSNTSEYEAKILEVAPSGTKQYLVHYQGWNNRHDEWVGTERIMKVFEKPDSSKKGQGLKPSPKPETRGPSKKKLSMDRQPASPSSVKSDSSASMCSVGGPGRPPGKSARSPFAQQLGGQPKPRPTRSNSIELLADGLPAKRRTRKTSSVDDSVNGSDSDEPDKSDSEAEDEKKTEQDISAASDTVTKATSMPSITSESLDEPEVKELDSSMDLSPPKLNKVVDISKEKIEVDDEPEEVDDSTTKSVKEPLAPVLNVIEMDNKDVEEVKCEDEELGNKSVEQKVVTDVIETESLVKTEEKEVKEIKKEVKKKEPEKRGRKPAVKMEKDKVEKDKMEQTEKSVPDYEIEQKTVVEDVDLKEAVSTEVAKTEEDSLYDFKDEPETEVEKRVARKKPTVPVDTAESSEAIKMENREESPPKSLRTKDDACKDTKTNLILMEEKDLSKSDSEVERRGRKRKVTKTESAKDIRTMSKDTKSMTNVSVIVSSYEKKLANSSPERKTFVTLAEKKQGFSPMVRKVSSPPENCAIESAKSDSGAVNNVDRSSNKDEIKNVSDMVVIHKASPVKTDIVLGRKIEDKGEDSNDGKAKEEDNTDKEQDGVHSVKKKVRKKTKKKLEMEVQETTVVVRKAGRGRPSARKSRDLSSSASPKEDSELGVKDSSIDIDLHCEEEIRSRSVSPVTLPSSSFIPESQGFVPRVETIDCRVSDSQSSDSFSAKHESGDKSQLSNKSNMFENTPPTTPEHDSDDTSHQNSQSDQQKSLKSSEDVGSHTDSSQATGHESPNGNASPSSRSTGSSSGVIAGSEGSLDMGVYISSQKRRRESDEHTPTKRRRRSSKGKANQSRHLVESDSEDMSKDRSPSYVPDSYQRLSSLASRSPRPQKYNFNLEEGQYLEGTARISFLVDKIQEIRKVYMNLKSEVACIDRRRKKLRRKEKESRSSSVVEVECS